MSKIGLLILLAASLTAWLLPAPKANAVLGRLDYLQFTAAWQASVAFGFLAIAQLTPKRYRRPVAFRMFALWVSVQVSVGGWEILSCVLPAKNLMDNPWYGWKNVDRIHPDIYYQRPAHLHWRGISPGNLARQYDDPDPYAVELEFNTDHQGFHNSTDIHQADVVFLGDSITEAGNVPEEATFVRLSADSLQVSARNLGLAAYCPPSEVAILEHIAIPCQPKVIVWQIFEGNDLLEAIMHEKWIADGRPPMPQSDASNSPTQLETWKKRSLTYRLFVHFQHDRLTPATGLFKNQDGSVSKIRFAYFPHDLRRTAGNPGWTIVERALQNGIELARKNGVEVIVLYVPMKLRILSEYVEKDPLLQSLIEPGWDPSTDVSLANSLAEACEHLGVAFVDATPALRAQSAKGRLTFFPFDTHLSPEGHRVISELLIPQIRRSLDRKLTDGKKH